MRFVERHILLHIPNIVTHASSGTPKKEHTHTMRT